MKYTGKRRLKNKQNKTNKNKKKLALDDCGN